MHKLFAAPLVAYFFMPTITHADDYYLGVAMGGSKLESGIDKLTGSASLDDSDTSARLLVGFILNEKWAIESQWSDYGNATLSGNTGDTATIDAIPITFLADGVKVKASATGYALGARYMWNLGSVTPYVRFGYHWWDADFSSISGVASENGHDPFYGLGVAFQLDQSSKIRLGFEQYEMDDLNSDIEIISIGYIRHY